MENTTTSFDRFSMDRFEFANGRRARGEGFWSFSFDGRQSAFMANAMFSEARRQAMVAARQNGVRRVSVDS